MDRPVKLNNPIFDHDTMHGMAILRLSFTPQAEQSLVEATLCEAS